MLGTVRKQRTEWDPGGAPRGLVSTSQPGCFSWEVSVASDTLQCPSGVGWEEGTALGMEAAPADAGASLQGRGEPQHGARPLVLSWVLGRGWPVPHPCTCLDVPSRLLSALLPAEARLSHTGRSPSGRTLHLTTVQDTFKEDAPVHWAPAAKIRFIDNIIGEKLMSSCAPTSDG